LESNKQFNSKPTTAKLYFYYMDFYLMEVIEREDGKENIGGYIAQYQQKDCQSRSGCRGFDRLRPGRGRSFS
jgi:hypothetical protein